MANLYDMPNLHNKIRASYLVFSFNGSMHCIHNPYCLSQFLQECLQFGPKHCKQTFWEIIARPTPGIEFEERLGESDDVDSL